MTDPILAFTANGSEPWVLATAQPNGELAVSERLERRGFVHHVFRIRSKRMHRGQLIEVLVPAFPRYIFVVVPNERWDELRSIEGVAGYVRDGDSGPARIPDAVVADLLARAPDGILQRPETPCPFRPGERVIVRGDGLIAGYHGIFQNALDSEYAIIEQAWLGRMASVRVRINDLEPASEGRRRKKRRHHRSRRRNVLSLRAGALSRG